jgi:CrcB protein
MNKEVLVLLSVFLGGGIGSVGRFLLSGVVQRSTGGVFPWGTMSVNVLGACAIGAVWAAAGRYELLPGARAFIFVGIFGGFTTFSAFSLETFGLFREGAWRLGLTNILLSNVACLVAVAAGFFIMRAILR